MHGTDVTVDAAGPTVAGLDWSWGEHAVCVLGADGTVLERFEAEHNAAGLRELVRRLARHRVGAIGIERGEGLVVETLLGAGLQIFVISPRQVRALRLRYGDLSDGLCTRSSLTRTEYTDDRDR